MKTFASCLLLATGLLLSACAGGSRFAREGAPVHELDQGKMIAVDQWARRVGATVVWVNPPRRSAGVEGG